MTSEVCGQYSGGGEYARDRHKCFGKTSHYVNISLPLTTGSIGVLYVTTATLVRQFDTGSVATTSLKHGFTINTGARH